MSVILVFVCEEGLSYFCYSRAFINIIIVFQCLPAEMDRKINGSMLNEAVVSWVSKIEHSSI